MRLLLSTPLLRAITAQTVLATFLVSGIWYERAAAATVAFATLDGGVDDGASYAFFAALNSIVGVAALLMQLFLFSHVLKCAAAALVACHTFRPAH